MSARSLSPPLSRHGSIVQSSARKLASASPIALALALGLSQTALAVAAEPGDVTLRMRGGGLEVTGALKAFDGQRYTIETKTSGNLTLDASRFECIGDPCARRQALPATVADRLNPGTPDKVAIRGSDVVAQTLLPALLKGYAASMQATSAAQLGLDPGAVRYQMADAAGADLALFDATRGTSAHAFQALAAGQAQIALSDRPMTAQEAGEIAQANPRFKPGAQSETVLAADVLAVLANRALVIDALPLDTVARILSGQVADWSELGLPPGKIIVYARDALSGTGEAVATQILKPRNLALSPTAKIVSSEADLADAIANDPSGFGVASHAFQRNAKALGLESGCGIVTRASPFAVKSGEYPLARRVYMYTAGPLLQPAARGFQRFATSNDAQKIIASLGFIDRTVEPLGLATQTARLAEAANAPAKSFDMALMRELLADAAGSRRLSVTFRFVPGSNDLDTRSKGEMQRLLDLITDPENAGKTIYIKGFANSGGPLNQASAAALKRAAQVRLAAIQAAAQLKLTPKAIIAKGYGPLAPVACAETTDGANLNRRVEVWIKD